MEERRQQREREEARRRKEEEEEERRVAHEREMLERMHKLDTQRERQKVWGQTVHDSSPGSFCPHRKHITIFC